jgi:hypothetical protein
MIYDFDESLQKVFNDKLGSLKTTDWRKWLNISSKSEFEDISYELSGIIIKDITNRPITQPRSFSVPDSFHCLKEEICFLCHTSGTSGGGFSSLKWYHFTKDMIRRLWAPGMKAIFESSGLNNNGEAVIFVPNRLKGDGFNQVNGHGLVRLYSSEFSQRVMLSLIKPVNYLFDEYRKSRSLSVLSNILSFEKISVLSAPASTILLWANPLKLKKGLLTSYDIIKKSKPEGNLVYDLIVKKGLNKAVKEVQRGLFEVLKDSTLIFSTSSLLEKDWDLIRAFFKWKKNGERYTNLFVGSETGPFAASLYREDKARLCVFPLTVAFVDVNGTNVPIWKAENNIGRLYVSRIHNSLPVPNIDTGDVVEVLSQDGMPRISPTILRAPFKLRDRYIKDLKGDLYAGDFFNFKDFTITKPRFLIECIKEKGSKSAAENPLVLVSKDNSYELIYPFSEGISPLKLQHCAGAVNIDKAFLTGNLTLKSERVEVKTRKPRKTLLSMKRNGEIPKGAFKKWPFYFIDANKSEEMSKII